MSFTSTEAHGFNSYSSLTVANAYLLFRVVLRAGDLCKSSWNNVWVFLDVIGPFVVYRINEVLVVNLTDWQKLRWKTARKSTDDRRAGLSEITSMKIVGDSVSRLHFSTHHWQCTCTWTYGATVYSVRACIAVYVLMLPHEWQITMPLS